MRISLPFRKNIKVSEIIYLKAKINYTLIYLRNGGEITVSKTLKLFEEELSEGNFFRIDRGVIINFDFVKQMFKSGKNIEVVLLNNIKIPVARRRRGGFNKFTRKLLHIPIK